MAVSSGSLPLSEIERAVTAGVRAALQAAVPQALNTPLTVSTLPDDTHRHPGTATASLATAVTSLRSHEHTSISREDIESLLALGTTLTEVAKVLQISRPTLYKLMQDYNIRHTRFLF
ncbi:uncharacterized protein LOC121202433 isoform X2 [Betta splendens]|uniref:Uncharacterized protein LOC121202433 isoform X2 n=1 Tax=Betta splendens TaxID=158456 RepID=A0A8M1HHR9_BETSP|nr:uncharacterized protein LOC121202433 isoform X2 [Betta splendens]